MESSLISLKEEVVMLKIKIIVLGCFLSIISLNPCWGSRPAKKEPTPEEQLERKREGLSKTLVKALAEEAVRDQLKESAEGTVESIMSESRPNVVGELRRVFNEGGHGNLIELLSYINAVRRNNQHERNAIDKKYHIDIDGYKPENVGSRITSVINKKYRALQGGRGGEIRREVQRLFTTTLKSDFSAKLVTDVCENMMRFGGSGHEAGRKIVEVLSGNWPNKFKEEHEEHYKNEIVRGLMASYSSAGLLTFNPSEAFQGIITNISACYHELKTFVLVHDPNTDTIFKFRKADEKDHSAKITDTFIRELQRQHDNSLFVIRYDKRVRRDTKWVNTDLAHGFHEILDLYVLKYGQLGLFWKWSERGWLDPKLCLKACAKSESRGGITDNVMFQYAFGADNICYHRFVVPKESFHRSNPYQVTDMNIIKTPTLQTFAESEEMFFWVFQREAIRKLWNSEIDRVGAKDFWGYFPVVSGFDLQMWLRPLLLEDSNIIPYVPTFLQYVQRGGEEIFVLEDINRACSINRVLIQGNTVQIFAQCPYENFSFIKLTKSCLQHIQTVYSSFGIELEIK